MFRAKWLINVTRALLLWPCRDESSPFFKCSRVECCPSHFKTKQYPGVHPSVCLSVRQSRVQDRSAQNDIGYPRWWHNRGSLFHQFIIDDSKLHIERRGCGQRIRWVILERHARLGPCRPTQRHRNTLHALPTPTGDIHHTDHLRLYLHRRRPGQWHSGRGIPEAPRHAKRTQHVRLIG